MARKHDNLKKKIEKKTIERGAEIAKGAYSICNSASRPKSPLNVPFIPMDDSLLKRSG